MVEEALDLLGEPLCALGWEPGEKALRGRLLQENGLVTRDLALAQRKEYPDEWDTASSTSREGDHVVVEGLLYSVAGIGHAGIPRLVIPGGMGEVRKTLILRAHEMGSHLASLKTYLRLRPYFIWGGMKGEVDKVVSACPTCARHSRNVRASGMEEMPIPATPFELVGLDLIC